MLINTAIETVFAPALGHKSNGLGFQSNALIAPAFLLALLQPTEEKAFPLLLNRYIYTLHRPARSLVTGGLALAAR